MAPIHRAPVIGGELDAPPMSALDFAAAAAQLGAIAHDLGLRVPGYKARGRDDLTPERAIVRYPAGPVVIVPNLRTRSARDTALDMADGLCEANNLHHDHPKRWMIRDRMELT